MICCSLSCFCFRRPSSKYRVRSRNSANRRSVSRCDRSTTECQPNPIRRALELRRLRLRLCLSMCSTPSRLLDRTKCTSAVAVVAYEYKDRFTEREGRASMTAGISSRTVSRKAELTSCSARTVSDDRFDGSGGEAATSSSFTSRGDRREYSMPAGRMSQEKL